jgi:hypothetical protein
MTEAQRVFEAIQRSKGQTDFSKSSTGRYNNAAIQVRWNYFQLGWEMRAVKA